MDFDSLDKWIEGAHLDRLVPGEEHEETTPELCPFCNGRGILDDMEESVCIKCGGCGLKD